VDEITAFARLIQALRPWLGHLVVVGGWAHRLHRLHSLAGHPTYLPLRTRDVNLALSLHAPLPALLLMFRRTSWAVCPQLDTSNSGVCPTYT
jgi:hypothetical protein